MRNRAAAAAAAAMEIWAAPAHVGQLGLES